MSDKMLYAGGALILLAMIFPKRVHMALGMFVSFVKYLKRAVSGAPDEDAIPAPEKKRTSKKHLMGTLSMPLDEIMKDKGEPDE
jgi:hypothetical protein